MERLPMLPSASIDRLPTVPNEILDPGVREAAQPRAYDPASAADDVDRAFHAALARFTGGLSPAAIALAFADWRLHLLASPGKQASLVGQALQTASQFADAMVPRHPMFQPWSLIRPPESDHRFTGPDWELPPFNLLAQAFLLAEQWWHSTTTGIHGFARSNAAIVDFAARQCLDMVAPTNFIGGNPKVLRKIMETGGGNFVSGLHNWIEDFQ